MGALLFCGFNFLLYNIGSALLFSTWNGWSFVDSMYFASVTFTTCGYGDLFPEGDTQQLITCVYILFGVIVLGSIVLDIVADHIVDTYEGTANEVKELQNEQFIHNIETNNNKKNNVTSQIAGGEEEGDSDSEGSFNTARSKFSTTPGLILDESSLPSIFYEFVDTLRTVIPLLLLIIGGAILIGYYEGWSIPTSIYYSIVTSTSVGYGDIVPETQRMKLFAIVYVPLSVALMAGIIGKITGVHLRRKALKDEYEFLNREMTKTDFELMDEDNDGEVTYEEFLTFMLVSMGKVDMEDMNRMKDLYEKLDTNGDGSIQLDDLMYCALGKES
jgi:potassium channel subfamily K